MRLTFVNKILLTYLLTYLVSMTKKVMLTEQQHDEQTVLIASWRRKLQAMAMWRLIRLNVAAVVLINALHHFMACRQIPCDLPVHATTSRRRRRSLFASMKRQKHTLKTQTGRLPERSNDPSSWPPLTKKINIQCS